MSQQYDARVISLGAGVQSTALYIASARGDIERASYGVFADTQAEPPWVYECLSLLSERYGHVIPIYMATAGSLLEDIQNGVNSTGQYFSVVPFWVSAKDGTRAGLGRRLGRRQCTREYKIEVVKQEIRNRLGLRKRQHAAGRYRVEQWIGISLDEAHRAKPSQESWITNRWPLLHDLPMRRNDCLRYIEAAGFPVPGKSACIFCPFRRPIEYARWRVEHPELFEQACQVDDLIRTKGTTASEQQFISQLGTPLRELPSIRELDGRDDAQLDLFGNECEGMCGV